jgi:hypothetical protein
MHTTETDKDEDFGVRIGGIFMAGITDCGEMLQEWGSHKRGSRKSG